MVTVVLRKKFTRGNHDLQALDDVALCFDATKDFTGQTTGITVWLHQNKGVFQRGIQQVLTCNQNGIGAHKISFA